MISIVKAVGVIIFIAYLFYDNPAAALFLLPYIPFYLRQKKKEICEKRRWELNIQFQDAIKSLSAVLESGYSVENAISETYNDLKLSYEEDAMIMKELRIIENMLKSNVPVETAFAEFAVRSGLEDIRSFSDVFSTAKRTGGNIIAIIRSTASVIRTRVELKRELKTMAASKKYESDIMRIMPFALLIYLRLFSPDITASLYGNTFGIVFMTVVLIAYAGLSMATKKLIRIGF